MRKKKKKTARLNERSAIMLKDELSNEYVGYYGNIPFRKRAKSKPEVCRPGDTFEEFGKTWLWDGSKLINISYEYSYWDRETPTFITPYSINDLNNIKIQKNELAQEEQVQIPETSHSYDVVMDDDIELPW